MSSGEISDDRFPLVTILLLKAMKGMETARVGMRESRKEMRRAVPMYMSSTQTPPPLGERNPSASQVMGRLTVESGRCQG